METHSSRTLLSDDDDDDDTIEDHAFFTPDLEYFTPPTSFHVDDEHKNSAATHRTSCPSILPSNQSRRRSLLPAFLPRRWTTTGHASHPHEPSIRPDDGDDDDETSLLLANVPRKMMTTTFNEHFSLSCHLVASELSIVERRQRARSTWNPSIVWTRSSEQHRFAHRPTSLLSLVDEQWFAALSLRWNIDPCVLAYNLGRLQHCTIRCLEQLTRNQAWSHSSTASLFHRDELAVALEFYLQIDGQCLALPLSLLNVDP
jgi:hypothetical protein